jgi:hypothetical protein
VTDTNTPTEDLELFDEAKEEFPSKEDLKDRLVAIWVTGKQGERKSDIPGNKSYEWIETITLVLDDGPDGSSFTDLVPAAPQRLDAFQLSFSGATARLKPRINLRGKDGQPSYKPMIGRVNSRKNKVKGMSDSWSIASPTPEEAAFVTANHADRLRAITAEVKAMREGTGSDDAAFD